MKKINKTKGPTLTGMPGCKPSRARRQAKGQTLLDFQRSDLILKGRTLTGDLANGQVGAAKLKGPTLMGFFPSSKLSPGLSNQPKLPIYPFWQSQCQIANLSPIL